MEVLYYTRKLSYMCMQWNSLLQVGAFCRNTGRYVGDIGSFESYQNFK